jgi:hypothetical protein
MHSLAPLLSITETRPAEVSGFVIPHDPNDAQKARTLRVHDTASMIAVRMTSGAVVKLLQDDLRGTGPWWVRVHGNRGLLENLRFGDIRMVRVRKERFDKEPGEPEERVYLPDFPHHHDTASAAGHLGADFFVLHDFVDAVRTGEQPFFDVYRGVEMSLVGILAYRSALLGSIPVSIPDFRDPVQRTAHADDDWSPDPAVRRDGQPWPSVLGELKPSAEARRYAEEVWRAT